MGANVRAIQKDLASFEGVEDVCSQISEGGRPVEVLALNAGVGAGGDFVRETTLEKDLNVIDLNVHMAKRLLPEMENTGVTVTALMPGPTDTEFFRRADMEDTKVGQSAKDDPAQVAHEGYEALMAGKDHVIAGSFRNTVHATVAHVLPDTLMANMHEKQGQRETQSH